MFDTPIEVPDKISTLELSKIWLYKALQNLERELQVNEPTEATDDQEIRTEDEDSL